MAGNQPCPKPSIMKKNICTRPNLPCQPKAPPDCSPILSMNENQTTPRCHAHHNPHTPHPHPSFPSPNNNNNPINPISFRYHQKPTIPIPTPHLAPIRTPPKPDLIYFTAGGLASCYDTSIFSRGAGSIQANYVLPPGFVRWELVGEVARSWWLGGWDRIENRASTQIGSNPGSSIR